MYGDYDYWMSPAAFEKFQERLDQIGEDPDVDADRGDEVPKVADWRKKEQK
jgi:hypothetical protein